MTAIHLSAVHWEHGDPHPVAGLGPHTAELTHPDSGLAHYRVSGDEIREMAARVAARTAAAAAGPPDLLVYVSENDRPAVASLAHLTRELGLGTATHLAVCGHGCGNLVPALQLARNALYAGGHERVLLVLADRVTDGERLMVSGLSVLSDGAAGCLVTREQEPGSGPRFRVDAMTTRTDTASGGGLMSIVQLAVDGVADLGAGGRDALAGVRHAVFGNYRVTSQQFLLSALGLPPDRLLLGRVADLGHCFSADFLVTLAEQAAAGTVAPGDRVAAAATGTHSLSVLTATCLPAG